MIKSAIFVEGQAEQIYTRELLQKSFNYSNIDISCLKIRAYGNTESSPYDIEDDNAENIFLILDCGGDNATVSAIIKRYEKLLKLKLILFFTLLQSLKT